MLWLASWPRSGNTLLRTIFFSCFGLHTGSIYPRDLGGNETLEKQTGHIEWEADGQIHFPNQIPVLKTHELPQNDAPAIYIVRNGRAACVSLWQFYNQSLPLEVVITGQHRFGSWANHVRAWNPWERPNTLLLHYEDLARDHKTAFDPLTTFLGTPVQSEELPSRDELAGKDGRWVRQKSNWREQWTEEREALFLQYNGEIAEQLGYSESD
ncbi:MAG: sulfotransferase domain-containing protein [Kamptonema sp. SIO4C4]|nr:sulfotransferase domain-containing protein [Kamptonema sp. SIO4C4]